MSFVRGITKEHVDLLRAVATDFKGNQKATERIRGGVLSFLQFVTGPESAP